MHVIELPVARDMITPGYSCGVSAWHGTTRQPRPAGDISDRTEHQMHFYRNSKLIYGVSAGTG